MRNQIEKRTYVVALPHSSSSSDVCAFLLGLRFYTCVLETHQPYVYNPLRRETPPSSISPNLFTYTYHSNAFSFFFVVPPQNLTLCIFPEPKLEKVGSCYMTTYLHLMTLCPYIPFFFFSTNFISQYRPYGCEESTLLCLICPYSWSYFRRWSTRSSW